LPLYIWHILNGLSAKKSAQIPYPAHFRVLKIKVKLHFEKEGFLNLLAEALEKRIKRLKI
jgi:hypothetical protein